MPASTGAQLPELWVFGNAEHAGRIHLLIYGPRDTDALVYEDIEGQLFPLRAVPIDHDGIGAGWDIERWHCGRRSRRFVVNVPRPDGSLLTAAYETHTPSCRDRLELSLPRRARRGGTVRARIRDRWRIGGVQPRLCVARAGGGYSCRSVRIPRGRTRIAAKVRLGRGGRSRVQLRLLGYRITREYDLRGARSLALRPAPRRVRVLLAGDSMMLNIDNLLKDRLRASAQTISDARVGSGLSKPEFNWIAHARRQVRRLKPDATVVFLGANDAFPMRTPGRRRRVHCCGEPWIQEYTRRLGTLMRIYRRNEAAALWLTLPAPRLANLLEPFAAVNEAIGRAAPRAGVRVLELDELFTPGFTWRSEMPVGGRLRRVRADDGIHLSLLGARIAAMRVERELRDLGLL